MEWSTILFHGASACYLIALSMSHMMWLRVFILLSTVAAMIHAVVHQYYVMLAWQTLFLVLNGVNIFELWRGFHKVHLTQQEEALRQAFFPQLRTGVFRLFWGAGETQAALEPHKVCHMHRPQEYLYFLLEGKAAVYIDGNLIHEVTAGHFFGEMAFLKKKMGERALASADVVLEPGAKYHVWHGKELLRLLQLFQDLDFSLTRKLEKLVFQKLSQKT